MMINRIIPVFRNSQVFVSLCAVLMGYESYLVANRTPDYFVLAAIFFSTLFIYNASRLNLNFIRTTASAPVTMAIIGKRIHLYPVLASIPLTFILVATTGISQVMIFLATALVSLLYMMPFSSNGNPVKGLRTNILLKNIILSATWAAATVLFPLREFPLGDELLFIFMRRFFFIYALTVVYDIRDIRTDNMNGMETLASRYGISKVKWIACAAIIMFFVFVQADPYLDNITLNAVRIALYVSGLITIGFILATAKNSNSSYYAFVIDGAMALQFLLVAMVLKI